DTLTSLVLSHPFFFQAEDGIRDFHVTGVQTCALPISPDASPQPPADPPRPAVQPREFPTTMRLAVRARFSCGKAILGETYGQPRSEERRVGKECGSRWGLYD